MAFDKLQQGTESFDEPMTYLSDGEEYEGGVHQVQGMGPRGWGIIFTSAFISQLLSGGGNQASN